MLPISRRVVAFSTLVLALLPPGLVADPSPRIGVLLANHGSRSANWRQALQNLEKRTSGRILSGRSVYGVKTAFMEYTEPSIATRMKEFDREKATDVVIVPVFLTVSGHTFDDIPTIVGQKADPQSLHAMKLDGIERYQPTARVHLAPRLDFAPLAESNAVRRALKLSRKASDEGVVLVAYGDTTYEKEWIALMGKIGQALKREGGFDAYSYAWCGHIAHYKSEPTTKAIESILAKKDRAIVLPILVAFDEMFQIKIIGGGVKGVSGNETRVAYTPDAILPDSHVDEWIVSTSLRLASEIRDQRR